MLPNSYDEQNCAIARSLEVIGERWTMLVIRDAMLGVRRFEDFQSRLGISRGVLAERLSALVENGVLTRERYQEGPERYEYLLSERGKELWPVVAGLAQWGGPLTPNGPPRSFHHRACRTPVSAEVRCPDCGEPLEPADVLTAPRPGTEISRAAQIASPVLQALEEERALLEPVRVMGDPGSEPGRTGRARPVSAS